MKKIFLILTVLIVTLSYSQESIEDGLRFAQSNLNGTARFKSMGGAFGALGGDLSSMNINPAGSVIFANNQIGVSLSNANISNKSNYFGTENTKNKSAIDLNQFGGVFVFKNSNSNWNKMAFSVNYENTKNLDNSVRFSGNNPYNSVGNYFLSYANGVYLGDINTYSFSQLYYNEQQAYLAYNAYVINPVVNNPSNYLYDSNVPAGANYYQQNEIKSTGYNGKLSINFATQYKEKLSLGININSHFFDYTRSTSFFERNDYVNTTTNDYVKRVYFNNDFHSYGSGVSLQLGAIVKPTKEVRIGLSYESPTWFKVVDETTQNVTAVSGNNTGELNPDVSNPNTTMILPEFKLKTPSKFTGSLAYVFGKRGLISLDYSMKNYNKISFKPKSDAVFNEINIANTKMLTSSSDLRLGAEYKIKLISLRGGYHWEQSPYKNHLNMGDSTTYSGGIGYNFGATKLDLAYSHSKNYYNQQMFSQGLTDGAKISTVNHSITATLLLEL